MGKYSTSPNSPFVAVSKLTIIFLAGFFSGFRVGAVAVYAGSISSVECLQPAVCTAIGLYAVLSTGW